MRHSPGGAIRLAAPTTRPPATTRRRSWPSGGISSCATAPVARNQSRHERPVEHGAQLLAITAEADVLAPAAEARLDDRRKVEVGQRRVPLDQHRPRVRQPGPAQQARGQQLVVGEDDRVRPVQHPDARLVEPLERPEPVLDPVERLAHVEPRERDVPAAERQQRLARSQQLARARRPSRPRRAQGWWGSSCGR